MQKIQSQLSQYNEEENEYDLVDLQIDHTFHLDKFIEVLENSQDMNSGSRICFNDLDCRALCVIVKKIFLQDEMILDIHAPIKVCGDLHGQIFDLMRIFGLCGHPSKQKYLFLGDYVDRGLTSLEVICTLFAYKLKYPSNIYMLRGNHESRCINRIYGFKKEVSERLGSNKTWNMFNTVFDCLPIAAIVDNSIFCCHGGISPDFLRPDCLDLRQLINDINRPLEVPTYGVMCDILWADPIEMNNEDGALPSGWIANNRGCSYTFGFDVIEAFLDKFNLDLIVRGHQVVSDGYEFYCDGCLVTVFSASNYCGTFDNAAGIFNLQPNLKQQLDGEITLSGGFHILPPDKTAKNMWIKSTKKNNKVKPNKKKGIINEIVNPTEIEANLSNG